MSRIKAITLAALRRPRRLDYKQIASELREVIREMADQHPLLHPRTAEQLQLLLVERMNRMVLDQEIEFGRIVGYNVVDRAIMVNIEITPVCAAERLVINLHVGP